MWITGCVRHLSLGGDQVLETCQIAVIKGTASATFHVIYHHNTTTQQLRQLGEGLQDGGGRMTHSFSRGWKDDSFFQTARGVCDSGQREGVGLCPESAAAEL